MNDEKRKLVLNKRTIARLNNLEMIHVRGGDGDENTSFGECVEKLTDSKTVEAPEKPTVIKVMATVFGTKFLC